MLKDEERETNRFSNSSSASLYSGQTSITAYHSSSRALPDALDLTVAPLDWRSDSYILLDEEGFGPPSFSSYEVLDGDSGRCERSASSFLRF